MRQLAAVLILSLALGPAPLVAADGMCEYRHPSHPGWDFFAACSYSETADGAAMVREVSVANGSHFTTSDAPGSHSVNGRAAARLDRDDAQCWRTEAEDELICIHPASAAAPVAEAAPAATAVAAAPGLDASFGGGQSGFCLLSEQGALVDYGACVQRRNCLEVAEGEGMSCLAEYTWASGRYSEMASADGWQTFDGGDVVDGDPGCVTDEAAGRVFCYSATAMSAQTHPVLAGPSDQPSAPAEE